SRRAAVLIFGLFHGPKEIPNITVVLREKRRGPGMPGPISAVHNRELPMGNQGNPSRPLGKSLRKIDRKKFVRSQAEVLTPWRNVELAFHVLSGSAILFLRRL